jgi:hypothetical protein
MERIGRDSIYRDRNAVQTKPATSIARHELLRQASVELVRTLLPTAKGIRLLGVTVSNFEQAPIGAAGELPLFDAATAITSGVIPAGMR